MVAEFLKIGGLRAIHLEIGGTYALLYKGRCGGPVRLMARALAHCSWDEHKEIGNMETKPATQNIQDTFLNTARKERSSITIYLMSGVKLTGRIRSFDKYSVVLETNNQEQLIFKHAISTVAVAKGHGFSDRPRVMPAPASSDSEQAPAASGTEG